MNNLMKAWAFWYCLMLALPPAGLADQSAGTPEPPDLVIVYTGDGRRKIEPAGCCYQIGGMARRATRISQIRDQYPHVLVLDCGDYLKKDPGDPEDDIRPDHVHRALSRIDYDALNIAGGELASGEDFLKRFALDPAMPLVSSNVRCCDVPDDRRWPPYRIKKLGDVSVGIIGLTAPVHAPLFDLADPASGIRTHLPALEVRADIIVLLSHLKWGNTKEIVREHPSIGLAIVGYDDYAAFDSETEGNTLMVKSVFNGGVLGIVKVWTDDQRRIARMESSLEMLESKIVPDPRYKALETDYRDARAAWQAEKSKARHQAKIDQYMKMTPQQFMEYTKTNQGKLD